MVGSPSCALFSSCTPHGVFCATCRVRVLQCSQAFRARHTPGIITQYDRPSTPVAEDALSASPEVWSLCAQCVRRRVHFRHFCTQPCRSWSDDSRGHHTSAGLQQCTRCAATPSWASSHHRLSPELRRSRTVRFHVVRTTFCTRHSMLFQPARHLPEPQHAVLCVRTYNAHVWAQHCAALLPRLCVASARCTSTTDQCAVWRTVLLDGMPHNLSVLTTVGVNQPLIWQPRDSSTR